jgi:hypothetical protein
MKTRKRFTKKRGGATTANASKNNTHRSQYNKISIKSVFTEAQGQQYIKKLENITNRSRFKLEAIQEKGETAANANLNRLEREYELAKKQYVSDLQNLKDAPSEVRERLAEVESKASARAAKEANSLRASVRAAKAAERSKQRKNTLKRSWVLK